MKKIGVCGHFGKNKKLLNGQTIKTKIIASEFTKLYGKDEIQIFDTHNFVKKCVRKLIELIKLFNSSKNILMIPARRGLKILGPLLIEINRLYRRKLHYVVIGGWLPDVVRNKKYLMKCLKKFDYIYVETTSMKIKLEKLGFENIVFLPNCKELKILDNEELISYYDKPYKLCTLSRIMEKKGINDAIKAVKEINTKFNNIFSLDIYGPIDSNYQEEFIKLMKDAPKYIKYKGVVDFDKTTEVLKGYFLLLFPTQFYTEGIPGTIIDAYSAGVPVISARWENYKDILDDKITGYTYEFQNYEAFVIVLEKAIDNFEEIIKMKKNCLEKAKEFSSSEVMKIFLKNEYLK